MTIDNYSRMLTTLACAVDARRVLEIGAGPECVSGRAFAEALYACGHHGAALWSVDIDPERPSKQTLRAHANFYAIEWHVIHGDSLRVALPEALTMAAVDLLYIDGDHGGEHVVGDYERYSPLVRTGGLIVFDDYPIADAVRALCDELAAKRLRGLRLVYNHGDGNSHYVFRKE